MTEIQISNVVQFNNGYVVSSSQILNVGTTYYLHIAGDITITKQYTPSTSGNNIIDLWGSLIPSDGNICYTLTDTVPECLPPSCIITVT